MLFIGNIGGMELVLVLLVALLFFGGNKIPELMRGFGRGIRSFKNEVKGIEDEISVKPSDKKEKD